MEGTILAMGSKGGMMSFGDGRKTSVGRTGAASAVLSRAFNFSTMVAIISSLSLFWWRNSLIWNLNLRLRVEIERIKMGHHHPHHHGSDSPYDDPFLWCCCCPCFLISSLFRRLGRCAFVACYPILQCFGCDDYRHHHHYRHFH
ncbi:hypothetical protein NE237_004618 [Protea cynaroides]|uniref:Uncharacterized protein n=1 Tax=Protea cynaroides TaxID=273540 RepID=A0A9Q0QTV5_9MAGN|nr:hypothetical protein NE237_004618 [Protea cynaroides]